MRGARHASDKRREHRFVLLHCMQFCCPAVTMMHGGQQPRARGRRCCRSLSIARVRSRFSRAVPARKNMFMVGSASSHDGHFIFNDFPIPMLGHTSSRWGQCTHKSRTSSYKVHTNSDGILIQLCIDHIHRISNHEYLFRCL